MNILSGIKSAVYVRLRQHSDETLKALLQKAAPCIRYLHDHQCTVEHVSVTGGQVTLTIDRPSAWLQGARHIMRLHGGRRETVWVASVLGCKVQWHEFERIARSGMEG